MQTENRQGDPRRFRAAPAQVPIRTLFAALVFFSPTTLARAQDCEEELVPNGSFETFTSCPTGPAQLALAAPWVQPTVATSDFFHACDEMLDNVSVPDNAVGSQPAVGVQGNGYAGFIALQGPMQLRDYREYLQVALDGPPLVVGKTYRFGFHWSLAEDSSRATDRIGAHFSSTAVSSGDTLVLPLTPQVETPLGSFLDDTASWTLFEDTFVAAGGEQYVTIGNFRSAADSGVVLAGFGPAPPLLDGTAYYYLDDVSLKCQPCVDPPSDLVAWWPLDETDGPVAAEIVSGLTGAHVGGPTPLPGYVGFGLDFAGSGVSVPTAPEIELATLDFTLDAWVRPDALGSTQALLAKIPASGAGYALVVNADGTLTFMMVDAALGSATGDSAVALAAGEWSHVTVVVDRDDVAGGEIHVDGTVATFDPTPAPASLTNALPLRFAQDGGAGFGADFVGALDEVEVFDRALDTSEVESMHEARTSGKCKIVLEIQPVIGIPVTVGDLGGGVGGDAPTIGTIGTVTNTTGVAARLTFFVRGEPVGTTCGLGTSTVDGPMNPVVLTPQPLQVGPGETVPVRFELDIPRDLERGLACYSVTATHVETGRRFVARGALRGVRPWGRLVH